MSYTNAKQILPESVIAIIQTYIQGEYIYIPKKDHTKKAWGENTTTKQELAQRNRKILKDHLDGKSTKDISERYHLSIKSIQRILLEQRKSKASKKSKASNNQ